jgi:hypothetical protein
MLRVAHYDCPHLLLTNSEINLTCNILGPFCTISPQKATVIYVSCYVILLTSLRNMEFTYDAIFDSFCSHIFILCERQVVSEIIKCSI